MGLFGRRKRERESAGPALGDGRRLQTDLSVEAAVEAFGRALSVLREPQYTEMPYLHLPGWTWLGPEAERPDTARVGYQENKEFLLATFKPDASGTAVGIFPLSPGDEQRVIGSWKQLDRSLTSRGRFPGGLLGLTAPPIDPGVVKEMITRAGKPVTARNLAVVGDMFTRQVVLKCYQFLEHEDPGLARHFADGHQPVSDGSTRIAQQALDDFAVLQPLSLPYVQDVPMRMRAIMLEARAGTGTFWQELED